ncbi:hypothetical protein D3C80_2165650 [compost metagenome]
MKNVYSADGSYQRAFVIAAIFGITGFILTFAYKWAVKYQERAADKNQKAII